MDILGKVLGLLVFLGGIAMIVLVFTWVRGIFDGIDDQVQVVHRAYVADLQARQQKETAGETDDAGGNPQETVVATPGAGPTLAEVATTVALKMFGLLVLGWLGALVAAKGAHLAGAYQGKSG